MSPAEKEALAREMDLDEQIDYSVLENLAAMGPGTLGVSVLNAALVYWALWNTSSRVAMTVWLMFIVAIILARFLLVLIFWRTKRHKLRQRTWKALYLVCIYTTAIGWGMLPFTNAFVEESWAWGLIVFVMAGMSAGGVVSLYIKLSAVIPYLLFILMPMIFVFSQGRQPADLYMAVLNGFYLLVLIRAAFHLNHLAMRTLRLDAEHQKLLDFLIEARRQLPKASATRR